MKQGLLSMIPLDHGSLLLFLPFGTGYFEDIEVAGFGTENSLTVALAIQGINISINPLLKYPKPELLLN